MSNAEEMKANSISTGFDYEFMFIISLATLLAITWPYDDKAKI